jgi:hypothetical protein
VIKSPPTKLLALVLVLVCWAGDLLFLLLGVEQVDELASHALGVLEKQWSEFDGVTISLVTWPLSGWCVVIGLRQLEARDWILLERIMI